MKKEQWIIEYDPLLSNGNNDTYGTIRKMLQEGWKIVKSDVLKVTNAIKKIIIQNKK